MKAPAKRYIETIRRNPRFGPQGFIKDLDTHAKVKIAHKIAFKNFEHLWSREWVVEEPALELTTRWLQKDLHASRSRSRAEAMIPGVVVRSQSRRKRVCPSQSSR